MNTRAGDTIGIVYRDSLGYDEHNYRGIVEKAAQPLPA